MAGGSYGGEKYNFDLCDFSFLFGELVCALVLLCKAQEHARVPVPGSTCDRSCVGPPVIETVSGIRTRGVRTRTGMVRQQVRLLFLHLCYFICRCKRHKELRVFRLQLAEERIEAGVADRLIESSGLRKRMFIFKCFA